MEEEYTTIAAAIILQAMKDYKRALLRVRKRKSKHNEKKVRELERFFLSAWGQSLSFDRGEYIIARCREEVSNADGEEVI